jgi:hypothetical protein
MALAAYVLIKMNVIRDDLVQVIGSFFIADPIKSVFLGFTLHFAAGVAFTAIYAYLFNIFSLDTMSALIGNGLMIGFVHGFFISYFFWFGISGYFTEETAQNYATGHNGNSIFAIGMFNIALHMLFGFLVAIGYGFSSAMADEYIFQGAYHVAGLMSFIILAKLVYEEYRSKSPRGVRGNRLGTHNAPLQRPI